MRWTVLATGVGREGDNNGLVDIRHCNTMMEVEVSGVGVLPRLRWVKRGANVTSARS